MAILLLVSLLLCLITANLSVSEAVSEQDFRALQEALTNVTDEAGKIHTMLSGMTESPLIAPNIIMNCGTWPSDWWHNTHYYSEQISNLSPVFEYAESGVIFSHEGRQRDTGSLYPVRIRCLITLVASGGKKWQIFSRENVKLGHGDYLFITEPSESSLISQYTGRWFTSYNSRDVQVTSSGPEISLYFFTNEVTEDTGFTLYFSQFRDAMPDCYDDEFECTNKRCIHEALECDGYPACSDFSDEDDMRCNKIKEIIIGVCVVTILILLVIMIACVIRKKKKKRIQTTVVVVAGHPPGHTTHPPAAHGLMPYQPHAGVPIISPAVSPLPPMENTGFNQPPPYPTHDLPPNQIPPPANYMDPTYNY